MEKLKHILSKVLGIDEKLITDETSPDNVETWDSFNSLMLISELESNFNVTFTMQEVVSIKSVKNIKDILEKNGVTLEK